MISQLLPLYFTKISILSHHFTIISLLLPSDLPIMSLLFPFPITSISLFFPYVVITSPFFFAIIPYCDVSTLQDQYVKVKQPHQLINNMIIQVPSGND